VHLAAERSWIMMLVRIAMLKAIRPAPALE
jgi:hypothetical protein